MRDEDPIRKAIADGYVKMGKTKAERAYRRKEVKRWHQEVQREIANYEARLALERHRVRYL